MCSTQEPLFTSLLLFTRPPVDEAQVRSQDPHLKDECKNFASKINNFQKIWQFLAPEAPIWPQFLLKSLEIWPFVTYNSAMYKL